jgi:hypothetical protein
VIKWPHPSLFIIHVVMSERRVSILIFVSLLLTYTYIFPRWLDWNQNSRFDLTAAIVERGELSIDAYVSNTGDYAESNGRAYSDKTPALSFLAVPVYALTNRLTEIPAVQTMITTLGRSPAAAATVNRPIDQVPDRELLFTANMALATLVTVAIPSALLGVLIYLLLGRMGYSRRVRALAVLVYGVATPALAYSAAFYSHQLAAILLFTAFAWIYTLRQHHPSTIESLALGALLGFTLVTELPTAPLVALLGLYAIWVIRRPGPLALLIVGGCLPLAIMGLYHNAIFGTPFTVAYLHHVNPDWKAQFGTGLLSANSFQIETLWALTFSAYRGLFFASPVLLAACVGFGLLARQADKRAEWLVSLAIAVGLLFIYSSTPDWHGGYSAGPRYLVPMLPFLVWPLAAVFAVIERQRPTVQRGLSGLIFILVLASIVATLSLAVGGQYYAPEEIMNPLFEYSWPQIAAGNVARNWGMMIGLPGAWSLLPLLGLIAVSFGAIWYATRQTVNLHLGKSER